MSTSLVTATRMTTVMRLGTTMTITIRISIRPASLATSTNRRRRRRVARSKFANPSSIKTTARPSATGDVSKPTACWC